MIAWEVAARWTLALILSALVTDVLKDGAGGKYEDLETEHRCDWCGATATRFDPPGTTEVDMPDGWLGDFDLCFCSLRCRVGYDRHQEGKT